MVQMKKIWKNLKAGAIKVEMNPAWGNACRNVTKDLAKTGRNIRWRY